jgi:hypothetical protein
MHDLTRDAANIQPSRSVLILSINTTFKTYCQDEEHQHFIRKNDGENENGGSHVLDRGHVNGN